MTIDELIVLTTRHMANLMQLRAAAEMLGDVNAINSCDASIAETQLTLNKLRAL
jgi:hypothetical protein